MVIGLVVALAGALLALIGSLSIPWVDSDVVRFDDPAMFTGWEWWPGKIAILAMVAALTCAIGGLVMHRKKLWALGGMLAVTTLLVFVMLTPFSIRGVIIEAVEAGTLIKGTQIAMYFGFHAAFIATAVMAVGFVWTLGAQPLLGPEDRLLRVALLWKGKMIKETTFTEKHDITIGDGVRSDFVVPAGDFGKEYALFRVDRKGNYSVALQREMKGRVNMSGVLASVAEFVKKHTADASGANVVPIARGDWGVLEFGDCELFFQFVQPGVIIGHRRAMAMDGAMISSTMGVLFIVGAFFVSSMFMWNPAGEITQHKSERRFIKVDASITQEKDEQLLEIGEEDDSVGKKAEGEEGKFGDPDKDPTLESKVPRRDGQMVSRIDPKKVGLADLLSNKLARSGAISSILSDADAFDNRMAVAMAGTGSELVVGYGAGGMGFKGTGPGGGGTGGYGRIHGLGRVDTGGGMGMRAGLGHKATKTVGKISLGGMGATGFCQRNNIQSVVLQRAGAIRACYEAQLQIHEGLAGKIAVRWTINTEGSVEGASITENSMGNSAVQECVLRAIRHMRFAKPEGGVCVVAWPFVFNPG
ncbi:MAG: energy transducer TonB [Deltaproteobacteria bacterium]|nr:energy transducer TonB [Deltaproteobacteria bacterium]